MEIIIAFLIAVFGVSLYFANYLEIGMKFLRMRLNNVVLCCMSHVCSPFSELLAGSAEVPAFTLEEPAQCAAPVCTGSPRADS